MRHWPWLALELHRHMAEAAGEAARLALGMIADTMCERLGCRTSRRISDLDALLDSSGEGGAAARYLGLAGAGGDVVPTFGSLLDVLVELDEAGVAGSSAASSVMCSIINSASSSSNGAAGMPRCVTPPLGQMGGGGSATSRGNGGGGARGPQPAPVPLLRSMASSSGRSNAWGMAGSAGHHARTAAAAAAGGVMASAFLVSEEELLVRPFAWSWSLAVWRLVSVGTEERP